LCRLILCATLHPKKKEPTPPPSSFSEEEKGEDDGDHSEFSIETDLDDSDDEYNPTPKGRNAQRQAAIQGIFRLILCATLHLALGLFRFREGFSFFLVTVKLLFLK
jgi:hypothetical protein